VDPAGAPGRLGLVEDGAVSASYSPARLRELALLVSPPSRRKLKHDGLEEAAAALRDFAAVVSVLDDAHAFAITRDGIDCIATLERWEPPGDAAYLAQHHGDGDTPLAAVLALARQIEGGEAS
jgi:hypothetical protein